MGVGENIMKKRELTPKQQAFADNYIETGNANQLAIKAGYSKSGWTNKKPYIILKGGRNILQIICYSVKDSIHDDSVYNKVQWVIKLSGLTKRFDTRDG